MAFTVNDLHDLIRILEQHPEWCVELRRVLLTSELLQLPELMRELLEVSRQHSAAIAELTEAQRRTEQKMAELAETTRRLQETAQDLVEWRRGEAGRRAGEQYEQRVIRRAMNIFLLGGEGGTPEKPSVHRRLAQWLRTLRQQGRVPDTNEDPLLADLIWWKGDRVLVVEVSLKVDDNDIRRARLRADTLREVGVDATPVVIGEEWAAPEVQALAQREQVEWMVESGLSQGFLQFRQLPDEVVPEATEQ